MKKLCKQEINGTEKRNYGLQRFSDKFIQN